MEDNGGPAFPNTITSEEGGRLFPEGFGYGGMTLRDYFAAKAMQAIVTTAESMVSIRSTASDAEYHAKLSYEYADAMIKERTKE